MIFLMLIIDYALGLIDYVLHKNDNSNSQKEKSITFTIIIN